ncbi:cytochrome P450 [Streptomyces sp. SID3343]|uniref:cytochrome P450 n=1 Tax=Streptomyces sp. SID3343 TaxID=2690260 RepID=UPI00136E9BC2|nr:cytochrome P450 [Streptomyces sp. SID3343]MYW00023.1 cytochrome P450 [Streptomyces sp. SID3343]
MKIVDWPAADVLKIPGDFPPGPLFTVPPILAELRDNRPLCPVEMPSGNRLWLVTRHADVRFVMNDPRFSRDLVFPGAPRMAGDDLTSVAGSLFNMEGDDHTRLRGVLSSCFTRRSADVWRATTQRHAHDLLDHIERAGQGADLVEDFSEPLVARVAGDVMGLSRAEHATTQEHIRRQLDLLGSQEQITSATTALTELAGRLVDRAAESKGGASGLVTTLARAAREGTITREEAIGTTGLLLMNVTDPLVPPLTVGVMTLLRHPRQLGECVRGPELWPEAVREVLRYHNNGITNFPRVAVEDVERHGIVVSAGEGIVTSALAAAHDPREFVDPHVFDVRRREKGSVFFGAGPHFCLGSVLATVVLAAAYEVLFKRLGRLRLAVEPHEVRKADGGFFACPESLPVTW